jgi:hypothetical protein
MRICIELLISLSLLWRFDWRLCDRNRNAGSRKPQTESKQDSCDPGCSRKQTRKCWKNDLAGAIAGHSQRERRSVGVWGRKMHDTGNGQGGRKSHRKAERDQDRVHDRQ